MLFSSSQTQRERNVQTHSERVLSRQKLDGPVFLWKEENELVAQIKHVLQRPLHNFAHQRKAFPLCRVGLSSPGCSPRGFAAILIVMKTELTKDKHMLSLSFAGC